MRQHIFHFASGTAAIAWVMSYGLTAYYIGEAVTTFSSPAAVFLGLAAVLIILAGPALILRYEKRLLAKIEHESPPRSPPA